LGLQPFGLSVVIPWTVDRFLKAIVWLGVEHD
jgi:hypothetical protein